MKLSIEQIVRNILRHNHIIYKGKCSKEIKEEHRIERNKLTDMLNGVHK